MFAKNGLLVVDEDDIRIVEGTKAEYLFFLFGNSYWYLHVDDVHIENIKPLRGIGVSDVTYGIPALGVHGKYELQSGAGDYKEWCKKANYLKIPALAICEHNTLAGTLVFQQQCEKHDIKSIMGFSTLTKEGIWMRLYAKSEIGWKNLMALNANISTLEDAPPLDYVLQFKNDIVFVITPTKPALDNQAKFMNLDDWFWQFTSNQLKSDSKDLELLNGMNSVPVHKIALVDDSYCIDKDDVKLRDIFTSLRKSKASVQTTNHWLKSYNEQWEEISPLYNDVTWQGEMFKIAADNAVNIANMCNFTIKTDERRLPNYEMTPEEASKFNTNIELFWSILQSNWGILGDNFTQDEYFERLSEETELIIEFGFVDYFLVLWDIIKWARSQNIEVGPGRGSAGGSLVAFLLGVTQVDPMEYKLLFSRFLNKGRLLSGGLPDIDTDFSSNRREEVLSYMKERYGEQYVAQVGTYSSLQVKGVLKELNRYFNTCDLGKIQYVTDDLGDAKSVVDIFSAFPTTSSIRGFIKENAKVMEYARAAIGSLKSSSIHACATILFPKEHGTMFEQVPVHWHGDRWITEWEGGEMDDAGFLKEDILSTAQMQKIEDMIAMIKERTGRVLRTIDIPIDDPKVFETMRSGFLEDVFQFGTSGMAKYTVDVQPRNFGNLVDIVALYRPGTMETGMHELYVKRFHGQKPVVYDKGLDDITSETLGIIIYQEQVMQAVQHIGSFTSQEADDVRRAMGKKKIEVLTPFREQFIENGKLNNYFEEDLVNLWEKLIAFAGYGFNRCLSADTQLKRVGLQFTGKSSYQPTIGEMYRIKNDLEYAKLVKKRPLRQKYRSKGYGSGFSMNEAGLIVKNKIIDIRYEGVRRIYRVTVESGATIDVTMNHKFPTDRGELMLAQMKEGDLLYMNSGWEVSDTDYRFGGTTNLPKKGQRGFQKVDTEFTRLREYLSQKPDICEMKDDSCKGRLEVHHIDGNHGNNDWSNLTTICASHHKREHYKMGRTKMGEKGMKTHQEKITSIEFLKEDDVYDVEMDAPHHNFVTKDNIVTSNSHSVTYAKIGYWCQWFKVNYPMEFWVTAFEHGDAKKDIPKYVSEIKKSGAIILISPDINESGNSFSYDFDKERIYWSLPKIKFIGDAASEHILQLRDELGGKFFSLEEFCKKASTRLVNIRARVNLALSGAFDEICRVREPRDRAEIVRNIYIHSGRKYEDIPADYTSSPLSNENWFFELKQVQICGLGDVDYAGAVAYTSMGANVHKFRTAEQLLTPEAIGHEFVFAGVIVELNEKKSKNGAWVSIKLDCNDEEISVKAWNTEYMAMKEELETGRILISSAKVESPNQWNPSNSLTIRFENKKKNFTIL